MSMHRRAYRELREAEMEEKQAEIIASHIPDWSQFATKQDMAELKSEFKQDVAEIKQNMAELKTDLMRWQWVQLGAIVALLAALRFIPFAACRKIFLGTDFAALKNRKRDVTMPLGVCRNDAERGAVRVLCCAFDLK